MVNKYISLEQDKTRLINIFDSEVKDGETKQFTIYCYKDKELPPNPIVYYHEQTVKSLEVDKILRIIKPGQNIDMHGPGYGGPLFYEVEVYGSEVEKQIQAGKTVTKKVPVSLPDDVDWTTNPELYSMSFSDGKKLEFNEISKPSAQYFFLLVENHGLPVSHEAAKQKTGKETNTEVKNLVKTLRGKITHNMLSTRVKIKPSKKGDYILLVSPKTTK